MQGKATGVLNIHHGEDVAVRQQAPSRFQNGGIVGGDHDASATQAVSVLPQRIRKLTTDVGVTDVHGAVAGWDLIQRCANPVPSLRFESQHRECGHGLQPAAAVVVNEQLLWPQLVAAVIRRFAARPKPPHRISEEPETTSAGIRERRSRRGGEAVAEERGAPTHRVGDREAVLPNQRFAMHEFDAALPLRRVGIEGVEGVEHVVGEPRDQVDAGPGHEVAVEVVPQSTGPGIDDEGPVLPDGREPRPPNQIQDVVETAVSWDTQEVSPVGAASHRAIVHQPGAYTGAVRVESTDPAMAADLTAIADAVRAAGGFVAEDFTVHESGGDFWCSIGEQIGVAGRLLVDYPNDFTVPMHTLTWTDDPDTLEPTDGLDDLSDVQRTLVTHWLGLVNRGQKLRLVRERVPQFALVDPTLRDLLAEAGYPRMAEAGQAEDRLVEVRSTLIGWHSAGGGGAEEPQWNLIPLKHLVNHDPAGAAQSGPKFRGRTIVQTSATSSREQTFENYGDLDALQLLMSFGYVPQTAPLVHSVPVRIEDADLGAVQVVARAPRNPRGIKARDVPALRRNDDDGALMLRHLSLREGNRGRIRDFLAMPVQSETGADPAKARQVSDRLLDALGQANLGHYRKILARLDEVDGETQVPEGQEIDDVSAGERGRPKPDGELDPQQRVGPVHAMLRAAVEQQIAALGRWW